MGGKSTYRAEDDSKICGRCKARKPMAEFGRNRTKADGHSSRCKWCDADVSRAAREKIRKHRKKAWMGRKPHVRKGNQRCYICGIDKPLSEFHRDRNRKTGHSVYCKPCACAKTREWWAADPERGKDLNRRKFGLRPGEYTAMNVAQGGACACCGDIPTGRNGLAVDHCHRTGRVRALLCGNCNLGLGNFQDDPDRLRKALIYLEK